MRGVARRRARSIFPTARAQNSIQGLNPAASGSRGSQFADPLDPDGLLVTWSNSTYSKQYASLFHPITVSLNGQTVASYVIPAVVSNGPDQFLGLPMPRNMAALGFGQAAPVAPNPQSDAYDDIYSFQLKGN